MGPSILGDIIFASTEKSQKAMSHEEKVKVQFGIPLGFPNKIGKKLSIRSSRVSRFGN